MQKGFTLIELMITVTLAAILLTLAVPSFQDTIRNNRLTTQTNEFIGALHLARSEAIKRGTQATICKSANGSSCAGVNWEDGWIVFSDLDGDGNADIGGGTCGSGEDCILRIATGLQGQNTLRGNNNIVNRVTFNPRGLSPGFNGTFTLCDSRGAQHAHGIILSNTGRPRRAIDSNDDGIEEDGSGNALSCPQ